MEIGYGRIRLVEEFDQEKNEWMKRMLKYTRCGEEYTEIGRIKMHLIKNTTK